MMVEGGYWSRSASALRESPSQILRLQVPLAVFVRKPQPGLARSEALIEAGADAGSGSREMVEGTTFDRYAQWDALD